MTNLFKDYVTGGVFNLSLRKSHIWVLAHIDTGDYHQRELKDIAATPGYDIFVPAVKSLINKGLVRHNPQWAKNRKPAYTLTAAGKHVVELLKLAELIYPNKKEKAA